MNSMKITQFGALFFSIAALLLTSFTNNYTEKEEIKPFVVVLDAGHGGHDPGNLGNGYLEKNIALQIVLQVGKILKEKQDIKVIYTRKDDTFVDLFVRGEIANKADADLFVSVHCDSHSSDAYGAGTFVLGLHANKQNFEIAKKENSVIYLEDNFETRYAAYDINSPESVIGLTIMQEEFLDQSVLLAKNIQDNFSNRLRRKDRKVKQAGFIVLHQTFMPSVLVETGFLTNADEGKYLNSKKGQIEMGTAIAEAILKYKEEVVIASSEEEILENAITETNIPAVAEPQNKRPEIVKKVPEKAKQTEEKAIASRSKKTNTPTVASETEKKATKTASKGDEVASNTDESKNAGATKKVVPKTTEKKKSDVIFKVQIFASEKDLALDGDNFRGLNTLSRESYKNLYRYMYGHTDSYFQATLLKSNADAKGYTTSYIVAYKNNQRISIAEAQKYLSE